MAFDLTQPSMTSPDWATCLGSIRENFRAIVQGDAGVFTKHWITADPADVVFEKSGQAAKARVTATGSSSNEDIWVASNASQNAGGTTWSRDDTAKVAWLAGISASGDEFDIQRAAAAANPITWAKLLKLTSSRLALSLGSSGVTAGALQQLFVENSADYGVEFAGPNANIGRLVFSTPGASGGALMRWDYTNLLMDIGTGSSVGGSIRFVTGNFVEAMRIDGNKNVIIGTAALATNATNGFFYLDSCAGTPTGTPTTYTGRIAMVYDTTNNKLYAYNGAWKSVTLV